VSRQIFSLDTFGRQADKYITRGFMFFIFIYFLFFFYVFMFAYMDRVTKVHTLGTIGFNLVLLCSTKIRGFTVFSSD
jgi:hypothetical protein